MLNRTLRRSAQEAGRNVSPGSKRLADQQNRALGKNRLHEFKPEDRRIPRFRDERHLLTIRLGENVRVTLEDAVSRGLVLLAKHNGFASLLNGIEPIR